MQKVTSYPKLNISQLDFSKRPHAHLVEWQGQKIGITTTKPNYGGVRYWLVCPYCEKRKGLLYQVRQAVICRVCAGLYYPKQDNKDNRDWFYKIMGLHEKQLELINQLDPALYNSYMGIGRLTAYDLAYRMYSTPKKPKGMHWTTYNKKMTQICSISLQLADQYKLYQNMRKAHEQAISKQWEQALVSL